MDHCQPQPHVAHIPLHREEYHHGAPHHTMAGPHPHVAHIPLHRGEYHHGAPHHTMAEPQPHVAHIPLYRGEYHHGAPHHTMAAPLHDHFEEAKAIGHCIDLCYGENPNMHEHQREDFCRRKCAGGQHTAPHLTRSSYPPVIHDTPEEGTCMQECTVRGMREHSANEAEVHESCLQDCGLLHGAGATMGGMGGHHAAPHLTRSAPGAGKPQPHVAHIPLHREEYHHGAPHHTKAGPLHDHIEKAKAIGHCLNACFAENPNMPREQQNELCMKKCAGGHHAAPHLTKSAAGAPQHSGVSKEPFGVKVADMIIDHLDALHSKLQESEVGRWVNKDILDPTAQLLGGILVLYVLYKNRGGIIL